jgi:hypothetical protein
MKNGKFSSPGNQKIFSNKKQIIISYYLPIFKIFLPTIFFQVWQITALYIFEI